MLHQALGRAADQRIIERGVAHIAHHEQVEASPLDEFGNRRNRMAGDHMYFELAAFRLSLCQSLPGLVSGSLTRRPTDLKNQRANLGRSHSEMAVTAPNRASHAS